jgi:hypothetical protein
MAPAKSDDLVTQLLAKNEEGNKKTHQRMEVMQTAIGNMESTVKSVMGEQVEFQRWRPEVETRVTEIAEALQAIQAKVNEVAQRSVSASSKAEIPATNGASGSAHLEPPSSETTHGHNRHHQSDHYRRAGVGNDTFRSPTPVGGTIPPLNRDPFRFETMGRNSFGAWSHGSGMGSAVPNMDFPLFDGSNPKLWKRRCETYFEFYAVEPEMWIRLAIMHFKGPAVFWLHAVENRLREMNWEEFCLHLNTRFGRDQHNLLIRQFYHIYQQASVAEYIEEFDILMHQLLAHETQLTSSMITARFVDGLTDEIKSVVVIQRPSDLDTVCSLALLQEDILTTSGRKDGRKMEFKGFMKPHPRSSAVPTTQVAYTPREDRRRQSGSSVKPDDSRLAALKAYRRAKGLCFKCGERWGHNHTCSTSVPLHLVEEMWALANSAEEDDSNEETDDQIDKTTEETMLAISIAAVSGGEGNRAIRLWTSIHCQQVLILVDSGSSDSFMGSHLMGAMSDIQKLKQPMQVRVADGRCMWSKYLVSNCQRLCGGINFCTDFKVLPLSGYDSILGMD